MEAKWKHFIEEISKDITVCTDFGLSVNLGKCVV
jgi:hypothetical protein